MSDSSELSSDLSSAPSDDESDLQLTKKDGILKFFKKAPGPAPPPKIEASPPRPKRDPSPPHEYVLADNPDIAFIVMFRSRFTEAFPKSLANFGPQELERDIIDTVPGEIAEHFLCALLGLLLNRKQDVKAGHYNRALEEAISTHKSQWARDWESKNPLSGGGTFASMLPTERLTLLRTLILWSLSSSESVKGIIQASYKQNRHEDDLNQPLSVQPWGSDGDRRRYFLIEGLDDTHFRVYRESNHTGIKRTWWSVAGDIDELKQLKRKRREYRQIRKQQFKRPETNFSMYEGRTRGKRMKYTYSDEEEEVYSDATTSRRSMRNTGTHTPAEGLPAPTVTQSGRQVKARQGGHYGESMLSGANMANAVTVGDFGDPIDEADTSDNTGGRPRRAAALQNSAPKGGRHIAGYNNVDEMTSDDEEDASEQDYGDDEEEEEAVSLASEGGEQDDLTDNEGEPMETTLDNGEKKSLVVKLPIKTPTPERKTAIKLRLSPEKELNSRPPESTSHGTVHSSNDYGSAGANNTATTGALENGSTDMTNMPKSPEPTSDQIPPMSPLAFRGSPEKPQPLPAAIGVHRGSV
ncbi:hypothetical protein GLAREA_07100 [Glarea lozoyensis ATCC 20868]|uniref:WHIM1 domain-containing protein n=1 Tax=Glarea lozoyensis (strain ATCC 20868 / MF5171) TaxID=1116229 RepID=S3D6G5_GLAL2|nr:uncharacterized protein GLAREA_07100 [Glarea lozoyensis ATCC 20868]EPE34087.1 hypothetical protein GLAREA_07100 [Glarea lozoyensis ATCC 20868]